uniref:Secreted protein n=1 Tax=Ixodes ricinus TaxID=34613 RepID=A0A6B0UM15_IXORI
MVLVIFRCILALSALPGHLQLWLKAGSYKMHYSQFHESPDFVVWAQGQAAACYPPLYRGFFSLLGFGPIGIFFPAGLWPYRDVLPVGFWPRRDIATAEKAWFYMDGPDVRVWHSQH